MFRLVLVALLLAGAVEAAPQPIDFTAVPREYVAEGITYRQAIFKQGDQSVSIELPPNWAFRSSASRLQLVAPQPASGEASIDVEPLAEVRPLDEAAANQIVQQALAGVPSGSHEPAVVEQALNPVSVGGHPSFGVTVSYKALGQIFYRNTVVVNLPDQRLVIRFTAPKSQFEALNAGVRRAVMSWRTVDGGASPAAPR